MVQKFASNAIGSNTLKLNEENKDSILLDTTLIFLRIYPNNIYPKTIKIELRRLIIRSNEFFNKRINPLFKQ